MRKIEETRTSIARGPGACNTAVRTEGSGVPINQAAWKMPDHWRDVSAKTVSKSQESSRSSSPPRSLAQLTVQGVGMLYFIRSALTPTIQTSPPNESAGFMKGVMRIKLTSAL